MIFFSFQSDFQPLCQIANTSSVKALQFDKRKTNNKHEITIVNYITSLENLNKQSGLFQRFQVFEPGHINTFCLAMMPIFDALGLFKMVKGVIYGFNSTLSLTPGKTILQTSAVYCAEHCLSKISFVIFCSSNFPKVT